MDMRTQYAIHCVASVLSKYIMKGLAKYHQEDSSVPIVILVPFCHFQDVKARSLNPLAFALRKVAKKMTVVDTALYHELIVDHFLVHVCEKHFLVVDKCLERLGVHLPAASLRIPHCLELISNSFLKDLQAILSELVIQFRQVRDWSDSRKHGVVLEGVTFRPEGCHHRNPLR